MQILPIEVFKFSASHLTFLVVKLWPKPNVAMDLAAFMDMTLLHEMTHTVAGMEKKDEGKAYGWINVVDMPVGRAFRNAGTPLYSSKKYSILTRDWQ